MQQGINVFFSALKSKLLQISPILAQRLVVMVKSHTSQGAHTSGYCSMKQLRVLLFPPGWDASPSHGYPQQYVAVTHLYTWEKRDNVG